eukprot:scaffold1313_cov406-Prasinococcus_capsulatus_cf.AAC.6
MGILPLKSPLPNPCESSRSCCAHSPLAAAGLGPLLSKPGQSAMTHGRHVAAEAAAAGAVTSSPLWRGRRPARPNPVTCGEGVLGGGHCLTRSTAEVGVAGLAAWQAVAAEDRDSQHNSVHVSRYRRNGADPAFSRGG